MRSPEHIAPEQRERKKIPLTCLGLLALGLSGIALGSAGIVYEQTRDGIVMQISLPEGMLPDDDNTLVIDSAGAYLVWGSRTCDDVLDAQVAGPPFNLVTFSERPKDSWANRGFLPCTD